MTPNSEEPRLYARGLTVRFGTVAAVKSVDIAVRAGELIAVTGPSGAGKTSLLNGLAGVYRPDEGAVRVSGVEIGSRDAAVGQRVVLIPQGNALVRLMSALENVALPLIAHRHPHALDAARAALAAVNLADAASQLVEELSGGQQQRLAIARALAEQGDVLLADEPTSELDAGNRAVVMALLRAEAQRGAAVVVATHDPEAAGLCDAELRLDEGAPSWRREYPVADSLSPPNGPSADTDWQWRSP
jgi:putative ABC transport system ATP-binding protein